MAWLLSKLRQINHSSLKLLSNKSKNINKLSRAQSTFPTIKITLNRNNQHINYISIYRIFNAPATVTKDTSLPGRDDAMIDKIADKHTVLKNTIKPPFPNNMEQIIFGMGCFWGAERMLWKQNGVFSTSVGYAGGFTKNPTYKEVCSGKTGHAEVVKVVFDPQKTSLQNLLKVFFDEHDPTQENRQGNDIGTQYRSAILYTDDKQKDLCKKAAKVFGDQLPSNMKVKTEIKKVTDYYYAEDYHQQYLQKNPNGYCGMHGTDYKLPDLSKLNISNNNDNNNNNNNANTAATTANKPDDQKDDL